MLRKLSLLALPGIAMLGFCLARPDTPTRVSVTAKPTAHPDLTNSVQKTSVQDSVPEPALDSTMPWQRPVEWIAADATPETRPAVLPVAPDRHQLARAVVNVYDTHGEDLTAVQLLLGCALTEDGDPIFRQTAIRALAPLARRNEALRKDFVPVLKLALADVDTRPAAIEAAGLLGRGAWAVRTDLIKLAIDENEPYRKQAKLALDSVEGWLHGPVDPTRKEWVRWGLTWIWNNQRSDGSWSSAFGDNRPAVVVSTAYCGLALLASGADFDDSVKAAADYVEANLFADLSGAAFPPMWDQSNWKIGIGGLFLCEYYACLKARKPGYRSEHYERLIQRLVDEAFERMEASGGWGHTPRVRNALNYIELQMMSNWMLMMAGAAQKLGARLPKDRLEQALWFVQCCSNDGEGGVGYSPWRGQKGFGCPCRTGGAIFAFALLGRQQHDHYRPMVEYWKGAYGRSGQGHGSATMGLLCSALGARQLGGECWEFFADRYLPGVLNSCQQDGSFRVTGGGAVSGGEIDNQVGTAYVTGIYCLILQLDRGHLQFLGRKQS